MATPSTFARYQLPAIIWAVLIFISSSIPAQDLPKLGIPRFDKVIHFVIYLTLAYLTDRAFRNQVRFAVLAKRHLIFTIVFTLLYGISDEMHQMFVAGREPSLLDLSADLLGALVLVAIIAVKRNIRSRDKTSKVV